MLRKLRLLAAGAVLALAIPLSGGAYAAGKTFYWVSHGSPADRRRAAGPRVSWTARGALAMVRAKLARRMKRDLYTAREAKGCARN
jgi:hypothetical protein